MTEKIESYVIDGKLYVTTAFIAAYKNITTKQIGNYNKKGMPKYKMPNISTNLFIINEIDKWVGENINKAKSQATLRARTRNVEIPNTQSGDIDETVVDIQGKISQANELLQLKGTSYEDADRIKKILDGLIQAVKLGEQTKELIPKRDTEKVIIEFASTLISGYKRDIKLLPEECENRNRGDIRQILESNYKTNVEKFRKIAKSELLSDVKIFDIIEEVSELLLVGIEPLQIVETIKILRKNND